LHSERTHAYDRGARLACGRTYEYENRRSHTRLHYNSCRANGSDRWAPKRKLIAYKGGKCELCGYARCEGALSFHHIDPTKSFTVAGSHTRIECTGTGVM